MNHGGDASNVAVRYDLRRRGFSMSATRPISAGEELRFAYAQRLCREVAQLTYGFVDDAMPPCPSGAAASASGKQARAA